MLDEGLLQRVQGVGAGALKARESLDGGDLGAVLHHREDEAGIHPRAVHEHRAGAALRDAAAELGAGQAQLIAEHPEKRHVVFDIDLVQGSVDPELHRGALPLTVLVPMT